MCGDDNGVGRRKKSDPGNLERNRHAGSDAGGSLTGIAVPETAGCKIVMVVFCRLGGRRWFARGGARCRGKTKRMLAKKRRQVTVGGTRIRVKQGMQRRSDELQAKRKDGKKQPEMTRAASSPAYSPVSPTPCLQTGLVLSAAPMEGRAKEKPAGGLAAIGRRL